MPGNKRAVQCEPPFCADDLGEAEERRAERTRAICAARGRQGSASGRKIPLPQTPVSPIHRSPTPSSGGPPRTALCKAASWVNADAPTGTPPPKLGCRRTSVRLSILKSKAARNHG